jgi:methyltransferase (TIGR00027 family)
MAVQRALESTRPHSSRLFRDAFARQFVSRRWRLVLAASRLGVARRPVEALYDRVAGPGPRASAVARTRLIDDLVTDALSSHSIGQLVILGAGFDSRAWRLPGLGAVTVFEADHPATQQAKQQVLGSMSPSASRVRFVPVNFEQDDLGQALRAAGYRHGTPSLFVWEGVTNYLTPAAVDQTLGAVRGLAAGGSPVVFTYVDRAVVAGDSSRFPEARRWVEGVRRRGEPWRFGLDPAEVGEFLARRGFGLVGDLSTADAGERYFRPLGRRDRGSALYHVVTASLLVPP